MSEVSGGSSGRRRRRSRRGGRRVRRAKERARAKTAGTAVAEKKTGTKTGVTKKYDADTERKVVRDFNNKYCVAVLRGNMFRYRSELKAQGWDWYPEDRAWKKPTARLTTSECRWARGMGMTIDYDYERPRKTPRRRSRAAGKKKKNTSRKTRLNA